jgi:hypothetical protein
MPTSSYAEIEILSVVTKIQLTGINKVKFVNQILGAIARDGVNLKISPTINAEYVFGEKDVLWWNWSTNSMSVAQTNSPPSAQSVALLEYRSGRFVSGLLLPTLLQDANSREWIPASAEQRCVTYSSKSQGQSIVLVQDRILIFGNSPDDHSSFGFIRVHDATTAGYPLLYSGSHNLGHAPSASYCEDTDTLMVGNGNAAAGLYSRIDLFDNFYARIGNGFILDWNNTVTTPRITIPFFEVDGSGNLTKQIDGRGALYGCVACFVT